MNLGFTRRHIDVALAERRMRRLWRGIYLLGTTLPPHAREMGAVLACSPHAALSHRSAAHLWQILAQDAEPTPIEVTVWGRNPGHRPRIRLHRTGSLDRSEVTTRHGIPVTTPTRTLLDFAAQAAARELEQAIGEAFALRRTTRTKLIATLERRPRRPGAGALRAELEAERAPARTRSPAEARLLTLIRGADLPNPEVNARVGRWEVDFLWPEHGVVVEVDGFAAHSSPRAFERDRAKEGELEEAGLTLVRLSARQVGDRPQAALARVTRALEAGSRRD